MKRILFLAAAVVAGAAVIPAAAGTGTTGATIVIDGGCDVFNIILDDHGLVTVRENPGSGCGTKYGVGVVGTSQAHLFGGAVVLSIVDQAEPGKVGILEISYPFSGSGTWAAYSTADGASYSPAGHGTYHTTK